MDDSIQGIGSRNSSSSKSIKTVNFWYSLMEHALLEDVNKASQKTPGLILHTSWKTETWSQKPGAANPA